MNRAESLTTYPAGLSDKHEAAAWLGVSVSWLEKAAAAREVPHTKVANQLRWSPDHLRAIVEANEVQVWQPTATARRGLRAVG
ncbi:helix-turn-helix domain-containing protein [Glycomyces paridis]|uniref:Helix-turn-helix domain-containing protein n=1 Tax=Glycomyces paridis TaxID=2126555 RepID=A0A4S8PDM8_9ACTN|nr:helix-turn-helix domain-containing protein [Glycomyces paridis]THV27911.1 helix-turn-helix domain-containing protein [Glycomyces paridis]